MEVSDVCRLVMYAPYSQRKSIHARVVGTPSVGSVYTYSVGNVYMLLCTPSVLRAPSVGSVYT